MKNFKNYVPEKYTTQQYLKIEDGIYQTKSPYDDDGNIFVTSLTFEFERDKYEEGEGTPQYIPQVPLEGILDEFSVYVTGFYGAINKKSEVVCYQEFGAGELENIHALKKLLADVCMQYPI